MEKIPDKKKLKWSARLDFRPCRAVSVLTGRRHGRTHGGAVLCDMRVNDEFFKRKRGYKMAFLADVRKFFL